MSSTDHNIQNPTKINIIDLLGEVSAWHNPTVIPCTKEFYDLLQTKDPHTMYIITDAQFPTVYYGTVKICYKERGIRYLMAPSAEHEDEFIIYMNQPEGWGDMLWEVCRFKDPQKALNALSVYNKAGSHHEVDIDIYRMIINFINDDITLNDLIIGCFCSFGYKENTNLQEVNAKIVNLCSIWGTTLHDTNFHPEVVKEIYKFKGISEATGNHIYGMYAELYDAISKYNFFVGDKYHRPDGAYLGNAIRDITEVFFNKIPVLH